jgi:alkyl hydroperoxide reductase subunit AhpC
MKRIGMYVLDFSAPALDGGGLIYLRGKQFMGRLIALCFLPHTGLFTPDEIDKHAQGFERSGATLIIVNSGLRPLHRLWIGRRERPSTIVLADPCGRLQRFFGVKSESSARCQTFIIDREGTLRLRLMHDFVEGDLGILRNMIRSKNVDVSDGHGAIRTAQSLEAENVAGVTTIGD